MAQLDEPHGLTFDSSGNLYVADSANHRIRMIDKKHVITTFARG
jgi:DNA-binding beta-propeller fold protein YncE